MLPGLISFAALSASAYVVNPVDFDGTNDYLTKLSDPTGTADGKQGTFSVWLRLDGGDGSLMFILADERSTGSDRFMISRTLGNKFQIAGDNTGGSDVLLIETSNTYTSGSTWRHLLASWDMATAGARHIYVNDVSDLSVTTFNNDTIEYTGGEWAIGATNSGGNKFNGCMAEFFFHTSYIDLSVESNRRKFITSGGKPEELGATGSAPLGVQPLVYLKNPAASFGTNSGSGGNFTINGTLDVASTSPSG